LTIGRDLIQDPHAAVIELVKNAYDADSPDVIISFERGEDRQYRIGVTDHGHGMSRETVIGKWMVPSTPDKEDRDSRSPGGRIMQGRKGIGRYAASILGRDILLETRTPSGEKTTLYLQWEDFESAEYLGDVEILIETTATKEPAGTSLIMTTEEEQIAVWGKSQFSKLQFELRKLMPPFTNITTERDFKVRLCILGVSGFKDIDSVVEPYPLVEHFDYRIAGGIDSSGQCKLHYSQQKSKKPSTEEINFKLEKPTGCGDLEIDIRVYDRDPSSIDQLIHRGLKDHDGNYLGKLQARQLLNDYNGIGVYRNGFRLRPLGDPEFDWLKLNEQRIQTPARKIGNNQVIGHVQIQSEEHSQLIEKSARDGLIENDAFDRLKEITRLVIAKLEEKRYLYRQQTGLGRKTLKVEHELEGLYSFETLKRSVKSKLSGARVSKKTTSEVMALIESDGQERSGIVSRLRDQIAVYQGQATLGKIINIVLHEGRKPLSYFRNMYPLLHRDLDEFSKSHDPGMIPKIIDQARGISENAANFVNLFERLDPLAAQRRSSKTQESLVKLVRRAMETFSREMEEVGISCTISGDESLKFLCWKQDIHSIFTNLIDNSLYWLKTSKGKEKLIAISILDEKGRFLHVDYKDTGPGIEQEHIESSVIFEPEFSTKPHGMGLGLAIAGESATRNGLELTALEHDSGAWFRLKLVDVGEESNN